MFSLWCICIFVVVVCVFLGKYALETNTPTLFTVAVLVLGLSVVLAFVIPITLAENKDALDKGVLAFKGVELTALPALKYCVVMDDMEHASKLIAEIELHNTWLALQKADKDGTTDEIKMLQPYDLKWIHFCTPQYNLEEKK